MSAYAAVFAARFRVLLQYRAAALAGLGTQIFWGFIRVAVFTAFYRSSTAIPAMSEPDAITYLWLTQCLLLLLPWRPDADIVALVRTGNVAVELVRPVDLHALWYARALAQRTAPALLRCAPLVVLALLFFGMRLPPTPFAALAFCVSLVCAVLLSAAFTLLLSVGMVFTTDGKGLQSLAGALVNFGSGSLVPLMLLPDGLRTVVEWLPFRGIMDTPFRLWLGHVDGWLALVGHQLAWTATLLLGSRWLLRVALRRLEVQGG
jgi:ABC-2 type transport system permease protein